MKSKVFTKAGVVKPVPVLPAGKNCALGPRAGWAAFLKGGLGGPEKDIQEHMAKRERDGNCPFVLAMVCKGWRKAQLPKKEREKEQPLTSVSSV